MTKEVYFSCNSSMLADHLTMVSQTYDETVQYLWQAIMVYWSDLGDLHNKTSTLPQKIAKFKDTSLLANWNGIDLGKPCWDRPVGETTREIL